MTIRVRFRCGHVQPWAESPQPPVCAACGERQIGRTFAPAPRFRGVASGPTVTPETLSAVAVIAAPSGPLVMKDT